MLVLSWMTSLSRNVAEGERRRRSSLAWQAKPLSPAFYGRPVLDVAQDLLGCVVRHGTTAGVIVETEAYHETEAACHAHIGITARTHVLFGPPGTAYVYRSYGIHALLSQQAWLESKVSEGGTALPRVREQLERARADLAGA